MVVLKTARELDKLRDAGRLSAMALQVGGEAYAVIKATSVMVGVD